MAEKKFRVVHYLNQFFGQVGGEEKATILPEARDGVVGPGMEMCIRDSSDTVETVRVKNVKTGKLSDLPVDGVFMYVGLIPNTKFLTGQINLDPQNYVPVTANMETNVPGVFAVGDVTAKLLRQVVTAVGDGATAAFAAEKYIEDNF